MTGETEEEDFDWQVEQQPFCGDEEDKGRLNGNVTYGFANRRSGVFKRLRVWCKISHCPMIPFPNAINK